MKQMKQNLTVKYTKALVCIDRQELSHMAYLTSEVQAQQDH